MPQDLGPPSYTALISWLPYLLQDKGLSAYLQLMAATIDQALMIQFHEQPVLKG